MPLVFVVSISIIREGYEDYQRYKSDSQVNYFVSTIFELSNGGVEVTLQKKWMDLQVGDIILVEKDQEIPADLILLASSNENSEAYIQTSSLDGEKNLKQKVKLLN